MKLFDVYPLNNVSIVRAEGSWVWDDRGTRYLDMYGGHAVISIGHTHPAYAGAVKEQLDRIGFYSNSVIIEQQRALAEALGRVSGKEENQLFLVNSGAEANENALKLASFHNGRSKIVAFRGSFHGRTSLAVAATDNPSIVAPVNRTDNVIFLPYNDIPALETCFAAQGDEISSVIVEGIQGVGGIRVATSEFLQTIRRLCDSHGAVYIADAVQCGCGRTGKYYSHDWAGVDADIYTMAKGIGNGFPVGAISISPKFKAVYGMLGTTFGGNQLACVAATAVAQTIEHDALMSNVAAMGDYLIERLKQLSGPIKEVRGRGLMIGIELDGQHAPVRRRLLEQEHIFTGSSGSNVIRLLPALNITREHVDVFLEAFDRVLKKY
jgi:acetylornithine aminotransferase